MDIEIGDDTFTKKPNILEEIAYRDTWGKGADSFIAMIYERLVLMRDLLAEDGSIYVHMGPKTSHYVRSVLDEVFGEANSQRELIWKRVSSRGTEKHIRPHMTRSCSTRRAISSFGISSTCRWTKDTLNRNTDSLMRTDEYRKDNCLNQNTNRPNLTYEWNGHIRTWRWTTARILPNDRGYGK